MDTNNTNNFTNTETPNIQRGRSFEEIIGEIFERNFCLQKNAEPNKYPWDYVVGDDIKIETIYTAYPITKHLWRALALDIARIGKQYLLSTIFVINQSFDTKDVPADISSLYGDKINLVSLENLFFLCGDDGNLRSRLAQCLTFSTENVSPRPLDNNVAKLLFPHRKIVKSNTAPSFTERLANILPGKKDFTKYENFCLDFVNEIFQNNIEHTVVQHKNNRDLYRFDIVAALKNNPESFWKFIYDKYNSCFILFECKNFSEQIGQDEIYSTERYLYNNALRNVAVIFSRKGANASAKQACQSVLKEHGKLILVLNDNDVRTLDNLYKQKRQETVLFSPSDYLFDLAKDFLLNLDK